MENENQTDLELVKKVKMQIKLLFIARIVLWVTAFAFTAHWIWYSFYLYQQEIFLPEDYSPLLRPVLYRGVIIAVLCILISFGLYRVSKNIKDKHRDIV
ncbi:MAG: hypothetical protein K5669_02755 [Lachnospiraceae bacterium]|nr:hypothetical protein [Lachnospiraceae bacterium]